MRSRTTITKTLKTFLNTSNVLQNVFDHKMYVLWEDEVPAVNITDDGEEIDPDKQRAGNYYRKDLDLVFEVITFGDEAVYERDAYDLEIETKLSAADSPLDSLLDSDGKSMEITLTRTSMEKYELSDQGDRKVVLTRIHWNCFYKEKIGV